ncbi:MAG: Npt1/Npt2 family nucleotide transporter [Chitinophagaceae bacterium]
MQQALLRLLNIRSHEWKLVRQMFIVQFFLVIGTSFLFISSDAIFLSQYHIIELPKAFFITGIFLLIFNRIYSKIEHKISTKHLLFTVIIFSIVLTFLIRVGFMFPQLIWMPYVLLIGYNIVYLLTALIFWGVAAMIFNVRESKRLFTIIGAGDLPAKLLGYLLVPLMGKYIGLNNTIWFAILAFLIAIPFAIRMFNMQQITMLNVQHEENKTSKPVKNKVQKIKRVFGSDLILTISILSLITFAAIILIDFTFLAEVQIKYHTDIELASFLGAFFAAGRILAVILKFTLSSRMIARMGLVWSLLLSPITLLVLIIVILSIIKVDTTLQHFIYLVGIMALVTEILKSLIQEPVFLVLFQPLKQSLRLKGHIIAKGYMLGVAMILTSGWLVWYLLHTRSLSIAVFCYVLIGILGVWILSIFLVKKEYLKTLYEAIKGGFFRGNELYLQDKSIRDLLIRKTQSSKPLEVITALDLLEREDHENINELLTEQLNKTDPVILKYALTRLAEKKHKPALGIIEHLLVKGGPEIRPNCIQAISVLNEEDLFSLESFMTDKDELCRQAAMVGMLKSNDLEPFVMAGQRLLELANSPEVADRISAAVIIQDTGEIKFHKVLTKLLNDPEIRIQKQAIAASGSILYDPLIPILFTKLKQKETYNEAASALIEYGDKALEAYKKYAEESPELLPQFITIAGGIANDNAIEFLMKNLTDRVSLRDLTIEQLWKIKFSAPPAKKNLFLQIINEELQRSEELLDFIHHLHYGKHQTRLHHALQLELDTRINNVLKILGFLYERGKISDTLHVVTTNDHRKIFNALEMMEMMIPRNIFKRLNLVIEEKLHPGSKIVQTKTHITVQQIIESVLQSASGSFNTWTKAMAMAAIPMLKDKSMVLLLKKLPIDDSAPIMKETRAYVISQIEE